MTRVMCRREVDMEKGGVGLRWGRSMTMSGHLRQDTEGQMMREGGRLLPEEAHCQVQEEGLNGVLWVVWLENAVV